MGAAWLAATPEVDPPDRRYDTCEFHIYAARRGESRSGNYPIGEGRLSNRLTTGGGMRPLSNQSLGPLGVHIEDHKPDRSTSWKSKLQAQHPTHILRETMPSVAK